MEEEIRRSRERISRRRALGLGGTICLGALVTACTGSSPSGGGAAPSLSASSTAPSDVPALLARYDDAVGTLARAGIRTILFTVVERTGTGRTADRLAARFHAFNVGVRATAGRHGAVLVDLAAVPVLRDRRLWHEDRLHLAPEGHARVAAAVLEALGVERSDWWRSELPGSARAGRAAALGADVRWVRVHLLPWIGRRIRGVSSGDRITAKHAELVEIIPD